MSFGDSSTMRRSDGTDVGEQTAGEENHEPWLAEYFPVARQHLVFGSGVRQELPSLRDSYHQALEGRNLVTMKAMRRRQLVSECKLRKEAI